MSNDNRYGRMTNYTYPYFAKCIYSGNEGIYDVAKKNLSTIEKEKLNFKFMNERCTCENCVVKRQERQKLIKQLKESGATKELRAMGVR